MWWAMPTLQITTNYLVLGFLSETQPTILISNQSDRLTENKYPWVLGFVSETQPTILIRHLRLS